MRRIKINRRRLEFFLRDLRVHVTEVFGDAGQSLDDWNVDVYRGIQHVGSAGYDPKSSQVHVRNPHFCTVELAKELTAWISMRAEWQCEIEEISVEEPDDRCPCCHQLYDRR